MAKVVLTIDSKNNKELKVKFAPVGHTPNANTTADSFSASVDWGDGTSVNVTSPNFSHIYTSGSKIRTITVNGGWGENEYLAFDKQSMNYVENLYVNPVRRSFIVIDNDAVNGDYINIKSHYNQDFHGLNKTNTETLYIKGGITWKLRNKTGAQLVIDDGSTDTAIPDNTNKNITVPASGTLTLTSGSVTQVIEIASNYKNNPKTIRNLWDKNTAVHMLVTSKLLRSGSYSPYQGGWTKEYKKIVIGGNTDKENNFVMHGVGDFALFPELRFLEYVGTTEFSDQSTATEYKPNLSEYKYTFAGCVQLRNGTSTSLVSKLSDSPSDITGMFSGTSQSVTVLKGPWAPIIAKKLSFEYLMILDRAFESSGYTAGLDGKLNEVEDKALESAIATFKGAKYAKGLWKLQKKLSNTADVTDLLANNTNFDNSSLKFLNTYKKVGVASIHKGGAVSESNMTPDVKRKKAALSVQTKEKPSWLKVGNYFFDGSVDSSNINRVMNPGDSNMYLVLPDFKIDVTDDSFPSWFANAAADGPIAKFMIIKKNYKGSLLALNHVNDQNETADSFIVSGVGSGSGNQLTDFSMYSHQSANLDLATTLSNMRDLPSAQSSAGGDWTMYDGGGGGYGTSSCNALTGYACSGDYEDENGPVTGAQFYNATDEQWQGKLAAGGFIATKEGQTIGASRNTNTFALGGFEFKDGNAGTANQQLKDAVALWMTNQTAAENTYGPINTWDVSAVTDMSNLFYDCPRNINSLDLTGWDTSNVTTMAEMFARHNQTMTGIKGLDVSTWDVSNVENMRGMFKYSMIGDLHNELNLTNWDVSSVLYFSYMFAWTAFSKGTIDFSNWVIHSNANIDQFKWKAMYIGPGYQSHAYYWGEMPGEPGVGGIQENKIVEITAVEDDYITVSDGSTEYDINKSGLSTVFEIVEAATETPTYPTNYDAYGRAFFVVEYNNITNGSQIPDPESGITQKDLFEAWKGTDELELGILFESQQFDNSSESYLELRLPLQYKDGRASTLYSNSG